MRGAQAAEAVRGDGDYGTLLAFRSSCDRCLGGDGFDADRVQVHADRSHVDGPIDLVLRKIAHLCELGNDAAGHVGEQCGPCNHVVFQARPLVKNCPEEVI